MRLLDQQDTDTPYYGVRRMTACIRSQGSSRLVSKSLGTRVRSRRRRSM